MAPQPSKHGRCTRQLVFLLLTLLLSSSTAALAAVVPTSYSSHCSSPSPAAPDRHADVSNDAELLSSFHLQPSTGFFSGRGANSLFSPNTNSEIRQQQQVSASIWRMDPQRIVTVASTTTLFCVFTTVLWRLRASRRNHEEPPAMSMAMHVVIISLGCVALEFILSHWVFFLITFVHMC